MSDEKQPGTGNEGGDEKSQTKQQGETLSAEELKAKLAEAEAALKKANREAMERRKRLEEIESAETKRKEAELSETEKAAKRIAEAEKRAADMEKLYRDGLTLSAVTLAATRMNFYDPEDAYRLADLAGVTINDNGAVDGVDAALKALAKAKPHLVKQTQAADLNAQAGGRQVAPAIDELVQRKRASGDYVPI